MKESKRVELWREFRKFLYEIGKFRQERKYSKVSKCAWGYLDGLALQQGLSKTKSDEWYIGYFIEIAWYVIENPRNEKQEWDDGSTYDLDSFRKAQLKVYGEYSEIKEWVDGE